MTTLNILTFFKFCSYFIAITYITLRTTLENGEKTLSIV